MHRFYVPPNEWLSGDLRLTGSEFHHARHVLRLQPGAHAVVFDGRGREATTEIAGIDSSAVYLRTLHKAMSASLRCHITLAQAIPKGKNMDLIVQKAVEIGAAAIYPLVSARTVVQLGPESAAQKQTKWQGVAIEAAKQCGQNWLPFVHAPRTPEEFFREIDAGISPANSDSGGALKNAASGISADPSSGGPRRSPPPFDLRLIGSLQPGARHLKEILAEEAERPQSVLMAIGPEGDFTPAELSLARSHGCIPLTLGPIILRVETAAIYCLSILSYELL